MANQKGGIKLRRSSKKKNYYAAQALRTARNKLRRKIKREKKADHWKLIKLQEAQNAS